MERDAGFCQASYFILFKMIASIPCGWLVHTENSRWTKCSGDSHRFVECLIWHGSWPNWIQSNKYASKSWTFKAKLSSCCQANLVIFVGLIKARAQQWSADDKFKHCRGLAWTYQPPIDKIIFKATDKAIRIIEDF